MLLSLCSFTCVFSQKGEGSSDPSHTGRWNSLELVKGTFGPDDCINDIAEIKFDRPLPIIVRFRLILLGILISALICSKRCSIK